MSLGTLMSILGNDYYHPTILLTFEDLYNAIKVAEDMAIEVLPYEIKTSFEKGLRILRKEVAHKAYEYFTFNDFEVYEEIIPLMRQVVACEYGGVDID